MIKQMLSKKSSRPRPTTADRFLFLIPGNVDRVTGGSIYNKRLITHLIASGARVEVISVPDWPYFISLIASPVMAFWVAIKLHRLSYDLLLIDAWAHPWLAPFIFARRIAPKTRLAIIVHQLRRRDRKTSAARFVASIIERGFLNSAQLIITVSRFMSGEVATLLGEAPPVVIAPPGCDHRRGPTAAETLPADQRRDQVRLLFVGNCQPRKGVEHVIRALSILKGLPVTLDVVGDCTVDGRYAQFLRREVGRVGLGGAVKFHGRVSDEELERFYRRADLFVMPSVYEGFGIVYGEAMRAGLPVIAADSGPVREIVLEGENALLVGPRDPDGLALAIGRLASDAHMRESFRRRSLALAEELPTWRGTCERVHKHLQTLAALPKISAHRDQAKLSR